MTVRSLRVTLVLLVLATAASGSAAPAPAPTPASRVLAERLAQAGRMEAALTQVVDDPLGGPASERRGRIAIERPERVRLDYDGGESVTLREDGGEWLQPKLTQMLVFDAAGAGAAATAWDLLLGRDIALQTRPLGPATWRMRPLHPAAGLPDSIEVVLDHEGLPKRLQAWVGGEQTVSFRMSGWHASRPRGRTAFVLQAPPGYEVIRSGR